MQRGTSLNLDDIYRFVAIVLSKRVPTSPPEIAREAGCSRATAYRRIEIMQRHFPIVHEHGRGKHPGKIYVRSRAHG